MMIWNQSKSYCALGIVVWNEVFTYFPVLYSDSAERYIVDARSTKRETGWGLDFEATSGTRAKMIEAFVHHVCNLAGIDCSSCFCLKLNVFSHVLFSPSCVIGNAKVQSSNQQTDVGNYPQLNLNPQLEVKYYSSDYLFDWFLELRKSCVNFNYYIFPNSTSPPSPVLLPNPPSISRLCLWKASNFVLMFIIKTTYCVTSNRKNIKTNRSIEKVKKTKRKTKLIN